MGDSQSRSKDLSCVEVNLSKNCCQKFDIPQKSRMAPKTTVQRVSVYSPIAESIEHGGQVKGRCRPGACSGGERPRGYGLTAVDAFRKMPRPEPT